MNDSRTGAPSRRWALELNPLELTFARASVNFEASLAKHDCLLLTVIAQPETGDIGAGAWGELGYRFYAGEGGLEGFFAGPSVGLGALGYFTDTVRTAQVAKSIDVAFDVGYQFAFRSGVMLGLGLGLQYQHVWHDYSVRNDPINEFELESSALPRLLFSIGYGQ